MPGILTAERRQKARSRARAFTNSVTKKYQDEKARKSKPPKRATYKKLTVDTAAMRLNNSDSISYSGSFNSTDYSSTGSNSFQATRGLTPTHESPRMRKSRGLSYDESTAECTRSPTSSLGSPAFKSKYDDSSFYSLAYEEDMPDDEMMSTRKPQSPSRSISSSQSVGSASRSVCSAPPKIASYPSMTPVKGFSNWRKDYLQDFRTRVNSMNGIQKMTAALISGSTSIRPANLSAEECILWKAVQTAMSNNRNEPQSDKEDLNTLKWELEEKEKLLKEQEASHQSEVLAIQRVLADVTKEKMKLEGIDVRDMERKNNDNDKELFQLKKNLEEVLQERDSARSEANEKASQIEALASELKDTVDKNEKLAAHSRVQKEEMDVLQSTLEATMARVDPNREQESAVEQLEAEVSHQKLENEKITLEKMEAQVALKKAEETIQKLEAEAEVRVQEMNAMKAERDQAVSEAEESQKETKLAQETVETLKTAKEDAFRQLEELMKKGNDKETIVEANSGVNVEEFVQLKKKLTETSASLETTKKIIASLESANGSLAVDSRSKLKEKEEELAIVQKESDDRKRNLDSLATELRDLQRKQGDIETADRRTKNQLTRQKALMDHLEATLNDLQEAVVVHESTHSNLEEISEILGDALHAINATVESSELYVEELDDSSSYGEYHEDAGMPIPRAVQNELDQKTIAVKRLEEALKKQNEDMRKMRSQFYQSDNNQMKTEIQRLRQQCSTNMEVLAKKERELSVLRSSLNVDDNESGYISDDASDDEDDDGTDVGSIMSAAQLNAYGPADAEAYATILSQANGRIGMPAVAQIEEIESLKKNLMEALGEKESASKSLANAKMIISSLEQANKGMMADLRLRLQDSNTAISSLLNKSKQHENEADELRRKLQALEQEKLEERNKYEAQLKQLSPDEKKEGPS